MVRRMAHSLGVQPGSRGGYRRRFEGSEAPFPVAHAIEPGLRLLRAPAVIAFEQVDDTDHHIKGGQGMELLEGRPASGGAGLLLEQEADQGYESVQDGDRGKRCKAPKGSDPTVLGP